MTLRRRSGSRGKGEAATSGLMGLSAGEGTWLRSVSIGTSLLQKHMFSEYALLLALVVIILIGTLTTLGNVLNQKLQRIIDQLTQAGG